MSANESTHITRSGPGGPRRRWLTKPGLAPVTRKPVKSIGRHQDRLYDPKTGRRRSA